MPALRLYNTLGRELQEFKPLRPGKVGFYGCGPTVYNYAHIGNLRAYVFDDILVRTLRFLGYEVKHVMNITDVGHLSGDDADESGEDKMVKSAKERGKSVLEIARLLYRGLLRAMPRASMSMVPDVVCKATEHIDDMIALIRSDRGKGLHLPGRRQSLFRREQVPELRRACPPQARRAEGGRAHRGRSQ